MPLPTVDVITSAHRKFSASRHATLVTVQWWHRVGEEVAVTEEHQPKTNAEAQPPTGGPQHDKGLLNTSGWWLLLWVLVVIVVLWLAEQVGFFGA